MYSGSTLNKFSGQVLGAHQKIDRLARHNFEKLLPGSPFPSLKQILSFEGDKGPDAIKRKSPAKDEPWHYFQPYDEADIQIIDIIDSHYRRLIVCLKQQDMIRAAFEAAWLAHAVVDGLTPAHHFPYEEKLIELRGGLGIEDRTTIRKKLIIPGARRRDLALNNWKMWGPKGLFTTHAAFEIGVATLIAPLKSSLFVPTTEMISAFNDQPLAKWYRQQAQAIADRKFYDDFSQNGWTVQLARQVRTELAPAIVNAVTIIWYGAANEAGIGQDTL